MSTIAGTGIIGPTGERLSTVAASAAEVQRLTAPTRPQPATTPATNPPSASAGSPGRDAVRVTLSAQATDPTNPANRSGSTDPTASAASYAAQLAQKRYLQNSSMTAVTAAPAQNGRTAITG